VADGREIPATITERFVVARRHKRRISAGNEKPGSDQATVHFVDALSSSPVGILLMAHLCKNVPLCKKSIGRVQFKLNCLGMKQGDNSSI
jgi:hypothetical protein